MNKLCFILLLCLNSTVCGQLVFSVDLIRHGDRTPTTQIPKFKYFSKNILGMLTERGRQQEYRLGQKLQAIYIKKHHLLSPQLNLSEIYVRATYKKRTQESAKFFLKGLYGSVQPGLVPVEIKEKTSDMLLARQSNTPMSWLKLFYLNNRTWRSDALPVRDQLDKVSACTGMPLSNFREVIHLADNLNVRTLHKVAKPSCISQEDEKILKHLSLKAMTTYFAQDFVANASGREIIISVQNYFQSLLSKKHSALRYVLYSAHDDTLLTTMAALKVPLTTVPAYASRLNFSLFENKGDYQVRVSLNDNLVKLPICHYQSSCALKQFLSL